ncbi:unnamed protein product [Camellia sinensis]
MSRHRDDSPAVRVYTVCDESKYLIVRNVPALGCGDELSKLFGSYGEIEEIAVLSPRSQDFAPTLIRSSASGGCDLSSGLGGPMGQKILVCKPKDDEDCEPFTDVYWIKFYVVNNARFAKRKLDEFVFLGNRLQVSYAPHYESLSDTKDKLEGRRKEVLARLNPGRSKPSVVASPPETRSTSQLINSSQWDTGESQHISHSKDSSMTRVTSDKDYFPSQSMNQTVQLVREKLNKIQSNVEHFEAAPSKKTRVDNRRRI